VTAVAAVGTWVSDAFVVGQAGEDDVEEAAEGEAEEGGEDGAEELEFDGDGWLLLIMRTKETV
jgi:hypothetical protein